MLRRIRGIIGTMLVWAIPWALAGTALGLLLKLRGGYQYQRLETYLSLPGMPAWVGGPIGFLATGGALVGAVNGLLFAIAVVAAHRRHRDVTSIPLWRFAGIGGVATGATAALVLHMPLVLAGAAAVLGAFSGAAILAVAQRGNRRAIPPGSSGGSQSVSIDATAVQPRLAGPQT
jgi:hypothetical protein